MVSWREQSSKMSEYYYLQPFALSRHPWRWISGLCQMLNYGVELFRKHSRGALIIKAAVKGRSSLGGASRLPSNGGSDMTFGGKVDQGRNPALSLENSGGA